MSVAQVIDALKLPASARVDRRVPKKDLIGQGAPTAADKGKIQDGIEDVIWIASLKPTNIAVPVFKDDTREYLEIPVLTASLRAGAKEARLVELIHRAVPYPVLLLTERAGTVSLSLAHKRWSQGQGGKMVVEEVRSTGPFNPEAPAAAEILFVNSLELSGLPRRDLCALYDGWLDRVAALEASAITGRFVLSADVDSGAVRRAALDAHISIQRQIAALRTEAQREKQMKRRADLNLEIKRLQAALVATDDSL